MIDRITEGGVNKKTRSRRRPLMTLAATAGILAASACLPQHGDFDAEEATINARVVGDSLTYQAEHTTAGDELITLLSDELEADGYDPDVVAQIGATTDDLASLIVTPENQADITVVGLGTNDMHLVDTETGLQPAVSVEDATYNLETYLDAADSDCEVLVGVIESDDWGLNVSGPVWNAVLAQEAAERGGVYVDWAQIMAEHPEYTPSTGGVHHTAEGQAAYRAAIHEGIDDCKTTIENQPTTTTAE